MVAKCCKTLTVGPPTSHPSSEATLLATWQEDTSFASQHCICALLCCSSANRHSTYLSHLSTLVMFPSLVLASLHHFCRWGQHRDCCNAARLCNWDASWSIRDILFIKKSRHLSRLDNISATYLSESSMNDICWMWMDHILCRLNMCTYYYIIINYHNNS